MNKSWKLIPKILSGEKTIESRWYKTRRAPWDKIKPGDTVFFKNSGEPVSAKARVMKVLQFSINQSSDPVHIIAKYGKQICIVNSNPDTWDSKPNYCILVFLADAKPVKPFAINKTGFGNSTAWIVVNNINLIRAKQ